MGYRPPSTGHKLDFSDTQYAGLEVTTGSVPLGVLLDIAEKAAAVEDGIGGAVGARGLLSSFAGVLESWNVEDKDGHAVPATLEGLLSQDTTFVLQIIMTWIESMTAAPPPLPGGSASGGNSAEAQTAAALSRSLPS